MASVAATDRLIAQSPEVAAAAVRAIVETQNTLKRDVALAAEVGRRLFPPSEAGLIAELIRRDLPYFDAAISTGFVAGMSQFARDLRLIDRPLTYEQVVATQFAPLWKAA
jgi:ABC-type nitrate/sulfonate/bicarbonate transport system substrate-binding protein